MSRDCPKLWTPNFFKFALNTKFQHFRGSVVHPFHIHPPPLPPINTRLDMPKKSRKAQAALTREAALRGCPAQPQVPDSSSEYEPGPSDEEDYTSSVSNDAEMHLGSPNHEVATNNHEAATNNHEGEDQWQLHNCKDTCSKVSRSVFSCHHSQFLSKNMAVHGCIPVSELVLTASGLIFHKQYWTHRCSRFQSCEAIQVSPTSWTHRFDVDFSTHFLKILRSTACMLFNTLFCNVQSSLRRDCSPPPRSQNDPVYPSHEHMGSLPNGCIIYLYYV